MLLGGVGRLMRSTGGTTFSPASLFSSGEQGVWYDPSDFSTMFQDASGTTQVTGENQSVGLILDKSKGLAIGPELATSPDLSWNASSVDDTAILAPVVSGLWYRFQYTGLSTASTTGTSLRIGTTLLSPNRPITSSTPSSGTQYFQATATGNFLVNATANTNNTGSFSSVSVRQISGNHAIQVTTASQPLLQRDGSGFYHILFDGNDDFLVSSAIDFTGTDKVSLFSGVQKNSDATLAIIAEFSVNAQSNLGAFWLASSSPTGGAEYRINLNGTTVTGYAMSSYAAPIKNTIISLMDIAGADRTTEIIPRVNNATPTLTGLSNANAGTGNFGSYPLYLGRRGGTTLQFNGAIYGLVLLGRTANASEVAQTEAWVNGKTGAY